MAMTYGNVYVASVALMANRLQTIRALTEAESYPGPSLVIAYSTCIQQGINLINGIKQQKAAVDSGAWVLYRYNPLLRREGKNPLILDSKEPTQDIAEYMYKEIRFRALRDSNPERAEALLAQARKDAAERYAYFKYLADRPSAAGMGVAGRRAAGRKSRRAAARPFVVVGLGELLWDLLPDGKKPGGAPANFAYHARALGDEGLPVSRIGADALGREMRAALDEARAARGVRAGRPPAPHGNRARPAGRRGSCRRSPSPPRWPGTVWSGTRPSPRWPPGPTRSASARWPSAAPPRGRRFAPSWPAPGPERCGFST